MNHVVCHSVYSRDTISEVVRVINLVGNIFFANFSKYKKTFSPCSFGVLVPASSSSLSLSLFSLSSDTLSGLTAVPPDTGRLR